MEGVCEWVCMRAPVHPINSNDASIKLFGNIAKKCTGERESKSAHMLIKCVSLCGRRRHLLVLAYAWDTNIFHVSSGQRTSLIELEIICVMSIVTDLCEMNKTLKHSVSILKPIHSDSHTTVISAVHMCGFLKNE